MRLDRFFPAAFLALLLAWPLAVAAATVDRLYVLDCGENHGRDQSRWSPGVGEGKPIVFADSCFLIKHAKGWFLWDTGIPDAVALVPDGQPVAGGSIVQKRSKTLVTQLASLNLKPADIGWVAVSHTHGDHVGNVDLFPAATLLMQGAEQDWAFADGKKPFGPRTNIERLEGDYDVFSDGSVVLLSTPGHTPGHQSLLVKLARTGVVILSGDAVHFQDNWEKKRVPSMNTDWGQTLASMQRLEKLLAENKAQLWINHDKPSTDKLKHAPEFYD